MINISQIRIDGGTQTRVEINEATVAEYAEFIRLGGDLPPVVVFQDGANLWLADGFHRYHAHTAAGAMEIDCDVRKGTQREARLYAAGANAAHGLRRTNADKRKSVMLLLDDAEWAEWSDNAIAKACSVSRPLVESLRKPYLAELQDAPAASTRTVERNGKTYEQNTANIGKAKPDPETSSDSAKPVYYTPFQDPFNDDPEPSGPLPGQDANPANVTPIPDGMMLVRIDDYEQLQADNKHSLEDNKTMGRVFDADDRIKAALIEVDRYRAVADNAERTLASKHGEFKARADQIVHWMGRAQRAEKKLEKYEAKK